MAWAAAGDEASRSAVAASERVAAAKKGLPWRKAVVFTFHPLIDGRHRAAADLLRDAATLGDAFVYGIATWAQVRTKREARVAGRMSAVRRDGCARTASQRDAGWPRPRSKSQAEHLAARACAPSGYSSRTHASEQPASGRCPRCQTDRRESNVLSSGRLKGAQPHCGQPARAKPSARALPSGLPTIPKGNPISGGSGSASC